LSTNWIYFEHLKLKIRRAEDKFKETGNYTYWEKAKKLQYIKLQLVENNINLQEEELENLLPIYTKLPEERKTIDPKLLTIKQDPQEPIEIKESESEPETESDSSDEEYIPSNQQEVSEEEIEQLYNSFINSPPKSPSPNNY
jgi:hypothetical protein